MAAAWAGRVESLHAFWLGSDRGAGGRERVYVRDADISRAWAEGWGAGERGRAGGRAGRSPRAHPANPPALPTFMTSAVMLAASLLPGAWLPVG